MRLISYNYTQLSETVISSSSQNSNFPASNIRHEHRSKEWRSSGYYKVTAFNNSLSFIEGVDTRNATIPAGTYNSNTLKTAIQSQMNLIGSNVYNVAYAENSGLWSITSDNSFTLTGTSTFNAVIGFGSSNRTGITLTSVIPAIHTEEFVTFDLKTTEEIDSIALLWGSGQYKLSNSAVIKVQASATTNFDSPVVEQTLTFNNDYEIASYYFSEPQSYRFWRVVISDPSNVNTYVNLGVVCLGLSKQIGDAENGFNFNLEDTSKVTSTDFGQEYVDIYPVLKSLDLDFSQLDYPLVELFIKIYNQVGNRKPVFVALVDNDTVFNKDCFSIYGKFKGSLSQKHSFYKNFSSGLSIKEIN